jgi:hypothetical protein
LQTKACTGCANGILTMGAPAATPRPRRGRTWLCRDS